jgi:tetratricopeptide (TPR) repeat protein
LGKQSAVEPVTEQSLRDAIARDPLNAAAHHSLAGLEEHLGNSVEAVREYQRAAELDASETNLFDWASEFLTHRAADQSIEVFAKGSRLFPRSSRMLLGLGAAFYSRGAYDEAALRFFEATDINPADPTPYLFLGQVQNSEIRALDGFLERMGRFAKLEPVNAHANYLYAVAIWQHSKGAEDRQITAQVEALLEKTVDLDPTLSDAYLQLGILHSAHQNFPQAIADYKKAIEAGSQSEEVHYRLAQAYQRAGEASKARQEFEIYNRLSKTSAEQAERERRAVRQFVFDLRTRQ